MQGNTIRPGHRWPANKPDVRRMPLVDRQQLVSGNPLAIVAGDRYVCALPIELFRAMSKLETEIDMNHPNGPAFFLPDIEEWPILEIVAWIRQLVEKKDYAYLDVMRDNNDELCTFRDLSLVRVGKLLGMQLYTNDMFNVYVEHIKSGMIGFEDVEAIVRLPLREDDLLLQNLGARLGRMMHCGDTKEVPSWLDEYLKDHFWLKRWVDKELDKQDRLSEVGVQAGARIEKKSRRGRARRSRRG